MGEERLEAVGDRLRQRFAPGEDETDTVSGQSRFVEGFVGLIAEMIGELTGRTPKSERIGKGS